MQTHTTLVLLHFLPFRFSDPSEIFVFRQLIFFWSVCALTQTRWGTTGRIYLLKSQKSYWKKRSVYIKSSELCVCSKTRSCSITTRIFQACYIIQSTFGHWPPINACKFSSTFHSLNFPFSRLKLHEL
jgi:hypothetical protein